MKPWYEYTDARYRVRCELFRDYVEAHFAVIAFIHWLHSVPR